MVQASGTAVSGLFAPIIERGTVLPASRVERFHTTTDSQKQIAIEVYQGEHSLCSENQRIGEYLLKGIPSRPAGEEAIEVRFSYDMNGVLDVDATIVSTQKTATFTIERAPGTLSRAELKEARARLSRLKFHPREALPNSMALARADALFVELVGEERARLGATLAGFRAALEAQDLAAIEIQRELVVRVTLELASRRDSPAKT
jgi:molecular chaperone HscC